MYPPLQYPNDGRLPTWTASEYDAFRCIALPSRSADTGVIDDRYAYDENASVGSITGAQLALFTRSMDYDDRDRLISATNGPTWGESVI